MNVSNVRMVAMGVWTGGADNVSNTNVLRSYIHVFTPQSAKFLSISPKLCTVSAICMRGKSEMNPHLKMISSISSEFT